MQYVSKAEVARRAGTSRAAVTHATKRGSLPTNQYGKIPLDAPETQAFIAKNRAEKDGRDTPAAARSPAVQESPAETEKTPPSGSAPSGNGTGSSHSGEQGARTGKNGSSGGSDMSTAGVTPDTLTYNDIRTVQTYWKAQTEEIKARNARGDLVERDHVREFVAKLWHIDTSQWQHLGNAVAPEVCAALGADDADSEARVRDIIERAVYDILEHSQRVVAEWIDERDRSAAD